MTIFIQKGDAPLDYRQAVKRGLRHFNAEKMAHERETGIVTGDPTYLAWAGQWLDDNEVNEANNLFNIALADYRTALDRLARYRLAEGRPEVSEQIASGEFDPETGEPVMMTVIVQTAIAPLPATIAVATYDPETGEQSGTESIPNPAIAADEAERGAAQAVIDATAQDVKDFDQ